jgi:hypothetical protein
MTRIQIDANLAIQLSQMAPGSELCDPAGRLVGYFLPADVPPFVTGVKSPIPPDELERRRQFKEGRPLAEFWQELKAKHAIHRGMDRPGAQ